MDDLLLKTIVFFGFFILLFVLSCIAVTWIIKKKKYIFLVFPIVYILFFLYNLIIFIMYSFSDM